MTCILRHIRFRSRVSLRNRRQNTSYIIAIVFLVLTQLKVETWCPDICENVFFLIISGATNYQNQ